MMISTLIAFLYMLACTEEKIHKEGMYPGECTDGADNDGDGDYDCNDSDCEGAPDCEEQSDTAADDTDTADTDTHDTGSEDTGQPSNVDHKIIAYFTEWGVYDRDFQVADIPVSQVTHIMYAFSNPTANGECVIYDEYAALQKNGGNLNLLQDLKAANPHLKTLISLGGWTLSGNFSAIAADPVLRTNFVDSCVDFMLSYGFDGIDVDWEYPVGGGLSGGTPADKENYTTLLSEFRTKLDLAGTDYLLTIAAPAGATTIPNMDIPNLAEHLDWINIMTYDFHGGWENTTNHHSPLYSNSARPDDNTASTAVQTYLDSGVPPEKLILGVPFYGKSWGGVSSGGDGLFQTASGVGPGNYEQGTMDYHYIADNYVNNSAYTRHWDEQAMVPYLYSATEQVFISYDDPESLQVKVDFIIEQGLGGAMFWEFSGDTQTQTLGTVLSDGLLE